MGFPRGQEKLFQFRDTVHILRGPVSLCDTGPQESLPKMLPGDQALRRTSARLPMPMASSNSVPGSGAGLPAPTNFTV